MQITEQEKLLIKQVRKRPGNLSLLLADIQHLIRAKTEGELVEYGQYLPDYQPVLPIVVEVTNIIKNIWEEQHVN